MAGIRLWRCTHCEQVASVIDRSILLCGDCFLRQTVEKIMATAFLHDAMPFPITGLAPTRPAPAADREYSSR